MRKAGVRQKTHQGRKLQWGRNLIVAEGTLQWRPPRSRKWLQWGRNLIVAEGMTAPLPWPAALASMGPQLDSCGRVNAVRWSGKSSRASMGPQLDSCGRLVRKVSVPARVLLQWGRNLIVAEGSWGRTRESLCRASMGPQLDSCGRYTCLECFCQRHSFNGAAT